LFEIFFGIQWIESGIYSRILALAFMVKFVVSPLSMTFPALNAVRRSNQWQILYFTSMLVLFLFIKMPVLSFLGIFAALEVGMYLLYLWLAWQKITLYENSLKTI
jgi:O-antigen/teichoic acid export membrane protein